MTTRAQIEHAVATYGGPKGKPLPSCLKRPKNEHDFNVAMAVYLARIHGAKYPDEIGPAYEGDEFTGWRGITIGNEAGG